MILHSSKVEHLPVKQGVDGSNPSGGASISKEEYLEISIELEKYHNIFHKFWEMGIPMWDITIPTACVRFDKEGKLLQFHFNPNYWNSLNVTQRAFIICHEAFHLLFNHGIRTKNILSKNIINDLQINFALDIVVNHALVKGYGFDRKQIDPTNDLCWVDTIFKDSKEPDDKSFEYYYNKINNASDLNKMVKLVDLHEFLSDDLSSGVLKELLGELTEKEIKNIEKITNSEEVKELRGYGLGSFKSINTDKIKSKRKWENLIKRWTKESSEEDESWKTRNRRYVLLPDDIILPSEAEEDNFNKVDVWMFLDTSGSCDTHNDRFFKLAKSLDPNRFNIRLFCFDQMIYETSVKTGKIYGGGGTSFHAIENYIIKHAKNYPKYVFIVTDGYGTSVDPKYPERWYWFLTEYQGSNNTEFIPERSKIYKIEDFEN